MNEQNKTETDSLDTENKVGVARVEGAEATSEQRVGWQGHKQNLLNFDKNVPGSAFLGRHTIKASFSIFVNHSS